MNKNYNRVSFLKVSNLALLMLALLFSASNRADSEASILEENNHFVRYTSLDSEITNATRDEITLAKSSNTIPIIEPSVKTNQFISIKTLKGIEESDILDWAKESIFKSLGYSYPHNLSEEELSKEISPVVVNIDLMNTVDETVKNQTGQTKTLFVDLFNICGSKPHEGKARFEHHFDEVKSPSNSFHNNNNTFTGNASMDIDAEGDVIFTQHYTVTRKCSIPVFITFRYLETTADIDVDGTLDINGDAELQIIKETIYSKKINVWEKNASFIVAKIFKFNARLDFDIDLGVNLEVTTQATVEESYLTKGNMKITWECTSLTKCDVTDADSDMKMNRLSPHNPDLIDAGISIKAKLNPYFDANISIDVDMIKDKVDLAHAKGGVRVSAPATYFSYWGTTCSDANADGINEEVFASLLDFRLVIAAYVIPTLGGKDDWVHIDLSATLIDETFDFMGSQRTIKWEPQIYKNEFYYDLPSLNLNYEALLLFRDIEQLITGDYSNIFQPRITIPEISKNPGELQLAKRSCYPYPHKLQYEIDWGDGTSEITSDSRVPHQWEFYGDYTIRVRSIGDELGRSFTSPWISKQINVSPNGIHPFRPWVTPVIRHFNAF